MTTTDPIVVRRGESRDVPALGRLGAALVRAHHAFDAERFLSPTARLEQGYAHFLSSQLAERDVVVYVAERGGRVIGYVYAGIEPRSWKELRDSAGFIHDVAVEPAERSSGVGSRLIETAVEWLVDHGAPRLMLWTAEQNHDARRLFERLGFRRTMVEMTREAAPSERGKA